MNNQVFGNYKALNSPLHRLDVRIKILLLILSIACVFLTYGNNDNVLYPYSMSLIVCVGLIILFLIISLISKVSLLSVFKSLHGILWLLIIIFILNVLLYKNGSIENNVKPLFNIGVFNIYPSSLLWAGYLIVRILLTLLITFIFTSTTKPMDIAYALEWYGTPLSLIKIPVSYFSMMMSLALRFIPMLALKTKRIQKSQASRGLDPKNGNLIIKIKSVFSLIIPLVVSSLYDSINVAQALDTRGYRPKKRRTHYKVNKIGLNDFVCLIIGLLIFGVCLFLSIYKNSGLRLDLVN